ncbi:PP2C family protein-serine/threonine phosphatase [Nafulsella turpanensis]|uniref:PP2C family protein-serine/threonine phosphatase n=1 Tax=Nafulsella turpanensis TaxID=1265690 RepID=UPI00034A335C|nr:SpoIIE family protein phosphatase [Nafulsella turpanensis]
MSQIYKFLAVISTCLLLQALPAFPQTNGFVVEGTIHGYEHNAGQGLFKKNSPTLLQGTLQDAKIKITRNGQLVQQLNTNEIGLFRFRLPFNGLYQVIISKKGYNQNLLIIDTRAFPLSIRKGGFVFTGAEFVLNSFKQGKDSLLNKNLGRLYFNPGKEQFHLAAVSEEKGGWLFSPSPSSDTPTSLLERAIQKNNALLKEYTPLTKSSYTRTREEDLAVKSPSEEKQDSRNKNNKTVSELAEDAPPPHAVTIDKNFNLKPVLSQIDPEGIKEQEEAIRREKELLLLTRLKAKTFGDSMEILRRERQIAMAEQEIVNAKLLITAQSAKLSAQKNSLYLMISFLAVSLGLSMLAYINYRQKRKNSLLVESKNRQITDSLNYARRIQQSILLSENILQQHLPESFVFLQPKDIVSGDFYFVAPIGQKYLVAVADCTGHGVPGAFMSLIGHRLLREIVVERQVHDPALVLEQLHLGIIESLNQRKGDEFSQDGMDISVCLIDPEAYTLVFAGAMNPAYLVHDQELQVLQADVSSVGGKTLRARHNEKEKRRFTNNACRYRSGCMLYLFTDGYMDQFSGNDDQKFNTKRFKRMLMDIQPLSAEEQKFTIERTFYQWKEETPQTDDVLIMGIRLL